MRRQFQVFMGNSEAAVYHVKPKVAYEWVDRGLAEIIGKGQVRLVKHDREVARSSDAMRSSGQRDAYELAAIESRPRFVQGGGVGGHRRQLKIDPFSGAKVGHQ